MEKRLRNIMPRFDTTLNESRGGVRSRFYFPWAPLRDYLTISTLQFRARSSDSTRKTSPCPSPAKAPSPSPPQPCCALLLSLLPPPPSKCPPFSHSRTHSLPKTNGSFFLPIHHGFQAHPLANTPPSCPGPTSLPRDGVH